MKIGIDIDGTITDNFKLIKHLSCSYFNKPEENIQCWEWDFCKVFDISEEEAQHFWDVHEEQIYSLPGPKPHALEMITKLAEKYEIVYITARTEGFSEHTMSWLKKHNIYFNKLYLRKDKHQVCKKEKVSIMIDDSPEYLEIANDIPLIMFDYPYNQHCSHPQIYKVTSWLEVYDTIQKINKNHLK